MGLNIRPAEPRDGQVIGDILMPVFRAGETYAIDPDIPRDAALDYWHGGGRDVFVAEVDGVILGTYYIRPNQPGGGAHICNCGYITAPEAQGKGIARAMLAHSLEDARAQGFRAMQFNFVLANNTRAVATWERAGFEVIGRIPQAFLHPKDGYVDALVMYQALV